jgi:hypothetical protein
MDERQFFMKEIGDLKAELSGMHSELKGLRERIDDALISQLRDHGKRIAALEAWRVWLVGWAAGAGLVSGVLVSLLGK